MKELDNIDFILSVPCVIPSNVGIQDLSGISGWPTSACMTDEMRAE